MDLAQLDILCLHKFQIIWEKAADAELIVTVNQNNLLHLQGDHRKWKTRADIWKYSTTLIKTIVTIFVEISKPL